MSKRQRLRSMLNALTEGPGSTFATAMSMENFSPKHEVDPLVDELLRALLWLQEKTCGGVELGAYRGQIVASVENCTVEFFEKMKVREKFPEWVEFGFFYRGHDLLRIELHFGKESLKLLEYDLMMGWGQLGKEG